MFARRFFVASPAVAVAAAATAWSGSNDIWSPAAARCAAELPPSIDLATKPTVVFVLGGPGAGKGTQCSMLVEKYGFTHLSAGDLLRAEKSDPTSEHGALINACIKEGKIVPVEITLALLRKAMTSSSPACAGGAGAGDDGGGIFLIDGFPRNEDNRRGWDGAMGVGASDDDVAKVAAVLFYDCPESTMEARLVERGKTSGRADDEVAVIRKRFHTFVGETMPIVKHFDDEATRPDVRVVRIDGTAPPAAVFAHSRAALEPLVEAKLLGLNAKLLAAVHAGDYATYAAMSDVALTAFEPETDGHLVTGLAFHKFFFPAAPPAGPAPGASTMIAPVVRLLTPEVALVTYSRLQQPACKAVQETRVWQRTPGTQRWRNVHFHRSR